MRLVLAALATLWCGSLATAEVHEVTQVGLTYQPDSITVNPGDTVRWTRTGGTHDAVHGDPCNAAEFPYFDIPLTASNPTGEWVVPNGVNGKIPYFCSRGSHCEDGMVAEILVVPSPGSTVIEVQQIGQTFVPEVIEVSPGDTVRWTHGDGGHTVSSGTHAPDCTEDNLHFNMPLDDLYTIGIWEVPESMPEQVDYICIYHCELFHVGTILRVDKVVGDFTGDGVVNGADLTILLGCWMNACGDLDGDGTTNGVDLGILLGAWTIP